MRRWLEQRGYDLCATLAIWRVCRGWPVAWLENAWTGIWYRFYCPHPTLDNWTARACVKADCCGCNNLEHYTTQGKD